MLRFSLSGVLLAFDVVHSSTALATPTNVAVVGVTLATAVLAALPEVTRWADAFIAGDPLAAESDAAETASEQATRDREQI